MKKHLPIVKIAHEGHPQGAPLSIVNHFRQKIARSVDNFRQSGQLPVRASVNHVIRCTLLQECRSRGTEGGRVWRA